MTTLERRLSEENESLKLEVRSLRARIDYLLRKLHGSSSEKIDRNQLMLELAELNDALGQAEAEPPREEPKPAPAPRAKAAGHGRRRLPETLEEQVVYLDPEEVQARPEAYREIGRETSERLDIVPPKLLRITTIRRKFVLIEEPQAA